MQNVFSNHSLGLHGYRADLQFAPSFRNPVDANFKAALLERWLGEWKLSACLVLGAALCSPWGLHRIPRSLLKGHAHDLRSLSDAEFNSRAFANMSVLSFASVRAARKSAVSHQVSPWATRLIASRSWRVPLCFKITPAAPESKAVSVAPALMPAVNTSTLALLSVRCRYLSRSVPDSSPRS